VACGGGGTGRHGGEAPGAQGRRGPFERLADHLLPGKFDPPDFARTETISDTTFQSEAGRRLAEAAGGARIGERVTVYQREDGTLAKIDEYQNDEDRNYLLRRLRDGAGRFRVLYANDMEFNYDFPAINVHTDIDALRSSDPVTQPRLF
jgi:hypothetical protein